jgi:hypothetical protein
MPSMKNIIRDFAADAFSCGEDSKTEWNMQMFLNWLFIEKYIRVETPNVKNGANKNK